MTTLHGVNTPTLSCPDKPEIAQQSCQLVFPLSAQQKENKSPFLVGTAEITVVVVVKAFCSHMVTAAVTQSYQNTE